MSPSNDTATGSPSGGPPASKTCANRSPLLESKATRSIRPARCSGSIPSAMASRLVTPMHGMPAARAMPRAAANPMRKPVKAPGPTVTAIAWISLNAKEASSNTSLTMGNSASA